jgi:protein-S-isoprenylcysteine O-methyltransferase Ste14
VTLRDPIAEVVFCAVMGCWVVFLATFAVRARRAKIREMTREASARWGMLLQFLGYAAVWLPPLQREQFSPLVPMPWTLECAVGAVTVAMAGASVWLVDASSRTLGKQWGLVARLVEEHDLVTSGPYRYVRNPIYAGMTGLLLATGIAMSRWEILIAAAVGFFAGTAIRIRSEERLLRQAFGGVFDEYARKVPALIPGIY